MHRNSSQALAQRARIVSACAAGQSNTAVGRAERRSLPTVGKWQARVRELESTVYWMNPVLVRHAKSPTNK